MAYRSGFIALIGRPNVGKSTLINRFMGAKVSITSPKPQTTRNKITAILTGEDYQAVFLDTPGIYPAKHMLGETMLRTVEKALEGVDRVLFVVEAAGITQEDLSIAERIKELKTGIFVIINKIDKIPAGDREKILRRGLSLSLGKNFCVSALTGEGIPQLQESVIAGLPEGPQYYPPDILVDHPERFIVAEFIREQVLHETFAEIPHAVTVVVEKMKKRQDQEIVDIEAVIYTERDSQKGIIIGANGKKLKEIAVKARANIEALLGSQIFLVLWVKVRKKWRNSPEALKQFGYLESE